MTGLNLTMASFKADCDQAAMSPDLVLVPLTRVKLPLTRVKPSHTQKSLLRS